MFEFKEPDQFYILVSKQGNARYLRFILFTLIFPIWLEPSWGFFRRWEGEIKGPISPVGTVSKAVGSQETATAPIIITVMLKYLQSTHAEF